MPIGQFRSGLVTAFAVMFGVVQLICACLPDVTAPALSPIEAAPAHQMSSHDMAAYSGHDMSHSTGHSSPAHTDHDHEENCSHCDVSTVIAASADIVPPAYTAPSYEEPVLIYNAAPSRAAMAETNLAGLRWLDPPRPLTNPTPVTLKIRSLT